MPPHCHGIILGLVFSDRYLVALLRRRVLETGGYYIRVSREMGLSVQSFRQVRKGTRSPDCHQIKDYLKVRKVRLYVPVGMSDEEINQRLALARRGTP